MPPVFTGQIAAVKEEYSYSQNDGWMNRFIEEGTPAYINGRIDAYKNSGFSVSVYKDGPYARLEAKKVAQIGAVPYLERWAISNEILTKDIFDMDWIQQEAVQYDGGMTAYRRDVEDVAAGKKQLGDTELGIATYAPLIIQELVRGVTSYETEYVMLSRERTQQSGVLTAPKVELSSNRYVYTTADLQSIYPSIPDGILFSLPTPAATYNGSIQLNTMWGWRVRDQEGDIDTDFKVTTRESWIYAQWSTFLYRRYS